MSNKRYKLKKDLPDSKAGDVYVLFRNGITGPSVYYKNGDEEESYWLQKHVENNPDWFELIEDKEWEILEWKHNWRTTKEEIFSVKRLNDGEVFSVGDRTNYGRIESFELKEDLVALFPSRACRQIRFLAKEQPITQEVFTWSDELVENFWHCCKNIHHWEFKDNLKWFKSCSHPELKAAKAKEEFDEEFWGKIHEMTNDAIKETIKHKYTSEDLEDAFWSGGKLNPPNALHPSNYKHPTFEHYLESKNKTP